MQILKTMILFSPLILTNSLFAAHRHIKIDVYNNTHENVSTDKPIMNHGHIDTTNSDRDGARIYEFKATSSGGVGGDTRVSGNIYIKLNPQEAFTCYFNQDHRGSPENLEISCPGDNGLYKFSTQTSQDSENGTGKITVDYSDHIIPIRFSPVGLGAISITACSRNASLYSKGYYNNPCPDNIKGKSITIQFASSPAMCNFTVKDKIDENINCGNGVAARYVEKTNTLMFLCQQTGPGASSCPWVNITDGDSFSIFNPNS